MTFVAAFYNFAIELNHGDRDLFTSFRLKVPRHELESPEHLYARMIAFLHCYRVGQTFSRGVSEPKEPTIFHKDVIGETLLWVQVGSLEKRKLELSLKQHPQASHAVYFFEEAQKLSFCHHLRGSKTNWVQHVRFYQIAPEILQELIDTDISSPHWTATFLDNRLYLNADGNDFETTIVTLDIWDEYQKHLREHPSSEQALK